MSDIEVVSPSELNRLWLANGMPGKRAAGVFDEIIAHAAPARDLRWQGGESRIVKLLTRRGRHVGTVHEVVLPDGSRPHAHPKDYTQRDCARIRAATRAS